MHATDESASSARPVPHETPRVLVFFDYACQFCYLDWPRFKRLRQDHEADLVLVPFELRPQLPGEGVPVSELGTPHSEHVEQHIRRMAKEAGQDLVIPDFVPNTHYALGLGEYARDQGNRIHEAVHEAIFSAYSGKGLDIGREDVLLDIASAAGLDREEAAKVFAEGRYDDRLHQFYHLAVSLGITATPSALVCNELLIGSRPYEVLEDALERCLVTEHNIAAHLAETVDPAAAES
ncbi:MAG: hypothetical protein CVT67_05165 [Actinobacteria bacterium HGW-Actinobacteria-7]|nr:MAG: hypothetical protein CVT67_05165 [Actinobacteria bacterium HGW-Actinobacteria-7]